MSLYDTYLDQAKELHKNEKKWRGTTVVQYIPLIDEVRKKHNIETMLDYGCGKAQNHPTYWKAHKYDPAIPEYSNKPDTKFDLVISTDVLSIYLRNSLTIYCLRYFLMQLSLYF
jgi:hypothetical protein